MDVSQRIKAIRAQKGIKQSDIARTLGIERTSYHRLENRGEKLTIEQTNDIAKALGVTLLDILVEALPSVNEENKEPSQLQSKVKELEDRLRDKQFIIDTYSRAKENITDDVEKTVERVAMRELLHLGLGSINEDPDLESDRHYIYRTTGGINFTQDDFNKIAWELYEANEKYFYLVYMLIRENLVDTNKPFIKPFLVFSRLSWPNLESVPPHIRQAMDDIGLSLSDLETLMNNWNPRSF